MLIPLASAVTSFVISFLIIPVIIKYSLEKNLVDIPGRRKIHKKVTPSMGGIAIFIGFFVASLIWIDISHWRDIRMILIALFMVFFIGVRDDLVPLRPSMKLIGQVVAATILVLLFDLRLKSMYGILGIYEIPLALSYLLTVFTIIVITNSFNLIDGLDGLAGTVASISLLAFGIWFLLIGDTIFAILAFCMVGSIVAFLIFNWEPSKIFMGDTGALVAGMMLSIMAIYFINTNFNLPVDHPYRFSGTVAAAVCFIIIPLVDTMRIFILRISRGQSPFTPDKSHIHHSIVRLGFTHSKTTILLALVQVGYIVLVVILHKVDGNYMILGVIGLSIFLSIMLNRLMVIRLNKEERGDQE